ncbi:MAG TPA: hypothetical protein VK589_06100 [Chryseolinea sp.]|nr:hypothetical protein [Chryseolinea sp.]
MKKPGPNIKAVWLWSALASILVTLSGIWYRFDVETTWAYVGIGVAAVGLTMYSLISKKS